MNSLKTFFAAFIFLSLVCYSGDGKFDSVRWKFKTGDRVFSTPVVVNETIYFGSNDNHLYAVNLKDGMELWKYETGGDVRSGIAHSNDNIYFGSTDGYYYSLDSHTGNLIWKFKTNGENEFDAWDYYISTPLVDDNAVYFGSGDSTFYSLNKNSGELNWSYKTSGIIHSSPTLKENTIFFGSFDGRLYALDKNSGEEEWVFNTLGNRSFPNGAIQGSPLLFENYIIFGSRDYNMYALNAENGNVMWNESSPSWIIAKPVADTSGNIYFGNSERPHLFARHYKYGSAVWEYPVSSNVFSNAVFYKDNVLFGSFNGKIYVMNKNSGELSYKIQTDASRANYSSMFNEEDEIKGEILSSIKTMDDVIKIYEDLLDLGAVIGTPIIHDDVLYVPTADGYLYAFE